MIVIQPKQQMKYNNDCNRNYIAVIIEKKLVLIKVNSTIYKKKVTRSSHAWFMGVVQSSYQRRCTDNYNALVAPPPFIWHCLCHWYIVRSMPDTLCSTPIYTLVKFALDCPSGFFERHLDTLRQTRQSENVSLQSQRTTFNYTILFCSS